MDEQSKQLNIGHGNPTFFRNWWKELDLYPHINVEDHLLYEYQEGDTKELENVVRRFHDLFKTDCSNSKLVFANGSTQVINAILYVLFNEFGRKLVIHYLPPVYMLMHEFISHCGFVEVTFDPTRKDIDVEIVIDPNNPTGEHRGKLTSARYVIFDRAYNWPIYTDSLTSTSDNSNHFTVYTISKALGMGGLRLGWAFINDNNLATKIEHAVTLLGICSNSFGQIATARILEKFLDNPPLIEEYKQLRKFLNHRRELLRSYKQIEVLNYDGPYAWITSVHYGQSVTEELLTNYNIIVYSGDKFASEPNYARLSLICEEFDEAISRLSQY